MAIIDTTQMPDMRHSPSYTKYAAVGALIGAVLMLTVVIIRSFMNDKVPNEAALEERYKLPVVGVIPDMTAIIGRGEYGRYSRYGYYGRKQHDLPAEADAGDSAKKNAEPGKED